jgi:hypothetical protein
MAHSPNANRIDSNATCDTCPALEAHRDNLFRPLGLWLMAAMVAFTFRQQLLAQDTRCTDSKRMSSMDDPAQPPFANHKRYYLFIKIAVLIIAAFLALQYF